MVGLDEERACDAVAVAFASRMSTWTNLDENPGESLRLGPDLGDDPVSDAGLLRDVRCQAIDVLRDAGGAAPAAERQGVSRALDELSERHREVVELVAVGRLPVAAVAEATSSTPREVLRLLDEGMRRLATVGFSTPSPTDVVFG